MATGIAFDPQDRQQMLGLGGSILLAFGVFAPLVSIPMLGHLNYFRNGQGRWSDRAHPGWSWGCVESPPEFQGRAGCRCGSLAVMAVTFVQFQMKMSTAQAEMQEKLAGNPFRGLARWLWARSSWNGWVYCSLAPGLMVASGLVTSRTDRRPCPHCAERIQIEATLCRFCGRDVDPAPSSSPSR